LRARFRKGLIREVCGYSEHSIVRSVLAGSLLLCIASGAEPMTSNDSSYASERTAMVSEQIAARDVKTPAILEAVRRVPRHRFVPPSEQQYAYRDMPLPIGQGQTISQPYIVALMTELVQPDASDRVLEVGTGSGYQAAVLAELVDHVYTIEIEPELARSATHVLRELGYDNVTVRTGDGYAGWPEAAPFDIIVVTAAPDHVPQALIDQLKPDGLMIVPVGPVFAVQQLRLIEKDGRGEVRTRDIAPVRFVPLRRRDE
jgi:protein-L-isoaspartate(D-aspartate) O-methyltransferase